MAKRWRRRKGRKPIGGELSAGKRLRVVADRRRVMVVGKERKKGANVTVVGEGKGADEKKRIAVKESFIVGEGTRSSVMIDTQTKTPAPTTTVRTMADTNLITKADIRDTNQVLTKAKVTLNGTNEATNEAKIEATTKATTMTLVRTTTPSVPLARATRASGTTAAEPEKMPAATPAITPEATLAATPAAKQVEETMETRPDAKVEMKPGNPPGKRPGESPGKRPGETPGKTTSLDSPTRIPGARRRR